MEGIEGLPLAAWATAHGAGVLVALLTRLQLGGHVERLLRLSLSLGIVGVAAIAWSSNLAASVGWVTSGLTLGTMVIAAVWGDPGRATDPVLARLLAARDLA
ncbi:MAG: hypothetical protein ACRCT8_17190 [Lacipirellulaceae bacterium]